MAKNLPKAMPVSASFVYDNGTGKRTESSQKVIKGKGDLRSLPSKNNGK